MRLALDIGGTHLRVLAAGDAAPERHYRARLDGMAPEDLVARLRGLVADWAIMPSAIGVSIAAVVSPDGRLLTSENTGWAGVPLAALLAEAFGCRVAVETDIFCGALHEARNGAARGLASALCVAVGTGIGHALVLDGRVWRGAAGGANALGHLVLDPNGAPCYCGHRGCLCQTASGRAQDGKPVTDAPILALARGIGAAVTLVEPEAVILSGGALVQAWFDLDRLAAAIPAQSYPGARPPRVVLSDEPCANLRGALLLASEAP
ncbi:MAG: ROK family protein [Amaricoccus sp.]